MASFDELKAEIVAAAKQWADDLEAAEDRINQTLVALKVKMDAADLSDDEIAEIWKEASSALGAGVYASLEMESFQ